MDSTPRVTVIGVGNEYRRDDGAGWAVVARLAERARTRPLPGRTSLVVCDGDPARLISHWDGADLAIVVDAAHTHPGQPGRVHRLVMDGGRIAAADRATSSHGLGLGDAVELARELDRLPRRLVVYAVEGADCSPGMGLSDPVEVAVAHLAEQITKQVARCHHGVRDR
ncbi:peptidase M52 [Kitasatospora herbaricolor]|uniref:hydrogenase maturation protease n=1 Tax=Kitasatospora herbaricolor TaxID=68217 RepID=UPI00199CB616|nr:hydrogenase maturation protease [Kitasatospora herbaricolor]MDQ0312702.1 hydrogenase maturation protease [Kitasatospora herbaricolor]GGV35212.1 peptidase M52 [Kitasatospora herbaricolor]